ncbi:hypothetical protein ARMSODRAFT_1022773 [Armillaria solidipes]|uniref:Uncharacterized protein n=1 Tax=Armillaria solidipes TaxID=1076256 RepID=A0A2H3B7E7_9AGAR|nr:hypothetical protein ARMSODRAFT_1022773 [Armillaria solidipes]
MSHSLKGAGKLPSTHIAGPTTRVLCAGHIFDLANKAIFRYFAKKAKVSDHSFTEDDNDSWLDDDDDDELDAEEKELLEELSSDCRDANEDAILEDLLEAVDNLHDLEEEDGNLGWNAVMKPDTKRITSVKIQDMIRAIVTQWLTHGTVLRHAIELRPALDAFCELSDWNKIPKKSVCKFKLDALEWEFIIQLKPILMMFAAATKTISESGVPLIHEIIPMFDNMINKLDKVITNEWLFPGVRAAAI